MKKCCFLILFLLSLLSLYGEKIVLFEKPDHKSRFLIVDRRHVSDTGERERHFSIYNNLVLIRGYKRMQIDKGPAGYFNPDFVVKADGKSVQLLPEVPVKSIVFCLIAAVLCGALLFRWKHLSDTGFCLLPILLRILLVAATAARRDFLLPAVRDEAGYFKTMLDMLNGVWDSPWSFTVGTGFLYLPFMLFSGAKEFYDIVPAFNYFSAFVFGGGSLALGFLILRKFNVSAKTACAAMLVWSIYPFVSLHLEDWNTLNFQQFFHYPQWFSRFNGHFYYSFCINSGFNAMSDMPGLFLVMACLYLVLVMPSKYRYAALFGALYGFACLVRINYILLAPLFAYVLWSKFDYRQLCAAALSSMGAFLAVFGIQLVCNTIQFGSPLTFGYILHYTQNAVLDRPAAGFTWHTFSKLTHLRYLFKINLPVFALGTAALWVMRDRFKQTVLVLLSVPIVLFFCGYSHTFCDARRFVFPAFAAFLMAAPVLDIWKKLSKSDVVKSLTGVILLFLLGLPFRAHWKGLPFLLGDKLFLRFVSAAVPIFLFVVIFGLIRRKHYPAALFLFLCALFFYGPPELLAGGMFLLLPWVAARAFLPQMERVFQLVSGGEDLSGKEE
ncbi:MAG: hypothetical protein IKC65_07215 [Lentisphaeria bacterium]|nr:hypothetical protein [Lentisphaeria bacterium]